MEPIIITIIRAPHQVDGVTIRPGTEGNTSAGILRKSLFRE
jgi:hypothetical protein